MPGRTGFQVAGLNETIRDLEAIGAEVEDLKDAFARISQLGRVVAARNAPHVTGRLAGNIRGNRAKSKAVVTAGSTRIPYAGPINYGWEARNIPASGFMQKADEEIGPISVEILENEINKMIKERGLK